MFIPRPPAAKSLTMMQSLPDLTETGVCKRTVFTKTQIIGTIK